MIIFGTRGITSTKDRGKFFCPHCNAQQDYAHKRVRRFFTLYFIPLIPLNVVSEFIQCARCGGSYREEVLTYNPETERAAAMAKFAWLVKRAMAQIMVADGRTETSELMEVRRIFAELTGIELSAADIQAEAGKVEANRGELVRRLREAAPELNDRGKELIVRAAISVAKADGAFPEEESRLIGEIADAIHMSSAHLRGIIAETVGPQ